MKNKIYIPHISSKYLIIYQILKKITKSEIITSPISTKEAINIGKEYSPINNNIKFQYDLGKCIYALKNGTNIIIEGFYQTKNNYTTELEREILEKLGYNFKYVNLNKNGHIDFIKLYKIVKEINPRINILTYIYYVIELILAIIIIDKITIMEKTNEKLINYINNGKISIYKTIKIYLGYLKNKKNKISTKKKVLLIGDTDIIIDESMNNNIIANLISNNFIVFNHNNLTSIMLRSNQNQHRIKIKKYLKKVTDVTGIEIIYYTNLYCQKHIDYIICFYERTNIPLIKTTPILNEISKDYQVPIIYLDYNKI